jgi:FlaA1/EpsC-like NDP-sugar epimerase
MSIEESVRLVLDSAQQACGGEVFITKMPVVRIEDLATAMIEELAPQYGRAVDEVEIIEIGTKPGEKLYEELMSPEETRRAVELEQYFSVMPAFRGIYHDIAYDYSDVISTKVVNPYVSEDEKPLTVEQIKKFLIENNLLGDPEKKTDQRYWPGDKEEES